MYFHLCMVAIIMKNSVLFMASYSADRRHHRADSCPTHSVYILLDGAAIAQHTVMLAMLNQCWLCLQVHFACLVTPRHKYAMQVLAMNLQ